MRKLIISLVVICLMVTVSPVWAAEIVNTKSDQAIPSKMSLEAALKSPTRVALGTIKGKVNVEGAQITVTSVSGSQMATATVDGQGNFEVASLYPGDYEVQVTALRYLPETTTVQLEEGETKDLGLIELQVRYPRLVFTNQRVSPEELPANQETFPIVGTSYLCIYTLWDIEGHHRYVVNLYSPGGFRYTALQGEFNTEEGWYRQGSRYYPLTQVDGVYVACLTIPFGSGTWSEKMPGIWHGKLHLPDYGSDCLDIEYFTLVKN